LFCTNDQSSSSDHVKHFILEFVVMPNKFALKLDELDGNIIDLANNFGTPMVVEKLEFLG
jgi:hypothetical protein